MGNWRILIDELIIQRKRKYIKLKQGRKNIWKKINDIQLQSDNEDQIISEKIKIMKWK